MAETTTRWCRQRPGRVVAVASEGNGRGRGGGVRADWQNLSGGVTGDAVAVEQREGCYGRPVQGTVADALLHEAQVVIDGVADGAPD